MDNQSAPAGGAFLVEATAPEEILTAQELPAEARLMAKTMDDFVRKEVLPVADRIEAHEEGLMRRLVRQAGELGLLAGGVPEAYGGLDLPRSAITLLIEKAAPNASFAISLGVHSGVSTLPLLYFGTPEQKQKYLPKLATGEIIGAFALSEADSGSDALSAQTRATLAPDGRHYLLSGTKMWTTNAGFADLFTVFAKVDGERFTAFLVERATPGLSLGREERKMGLRGSSTRRVVLENAPVPVENVLGEVGKGHRVALYPLNLGRFNIGASALGSCKEIVGTAARYAKQRVQFGRPIARFGLIRHKLAEMAVRVFVLESMVYRTAGYGDIQFGQIDAAESGAGDKLLAAAEEYAIECAIIKFFGTEVLQYVVDEGLQIHGGFGYSEEFPLARAYRDARVTRIFEGTNEINRLTVLDQLLRRVRRGRLPGFSVDQSGGTAETAVDPREEMGVWVGQIRRAIRYTIGQAWEALGERLADEQEIAGALADMSAALYALESAWLRVGKMQGPKAPVALAAAQVYGSDACAQVERWARCAVAAFSAGDALRTHVSTLGGLLQPPLLDTVSRRRQIAVDVLECEGYPW
jgi:alkylation response protein AidB-like acyl-CoA dehydrogenase